MSLTYGEGCAYCGARGVRFHKDHVVPRSRGGPDDDSNLILACSRCNLEKSDRLPSEWLMLVPLSVAVIEETILEKIQIRPRRQKKLSSLKRGHSCRFCGRAILRSNGAVLLIERDGWVDSEWCHPACYPGLGRLVLVPDARMALLEQQWEPSVEHMLKAATLLPRPETRERDESTQSVSQDR